MRCGTICKPCESVLFRTSTLLLVVLSASLPLAVESQELGRVGFGAAPLPAPEGDPLGGYGGLFSRNARGTRDTPQARALILEQSERRAALVVLDIVIARPDLRRGLDGWAQQNHVELLALIASHTHSGPGGYLDGWLAERLSSGRSIEGRGEELIAAARLALDAALADLQETRVRVSTSDVSLAVNRRDGAGLAADRLAVLHFQHPAGDILAVHYAMHPTVLRPSSRLYSGDYPAVLQRVLGERGFRSLFLPGPMGDQAPPERRGSETQDSHLERVGQALAEAVLTGLPDAGFEDLTRLGSRVGRFELPAPKGRLFCALWWLRPFVSGSLTSFLSDSLEIQVLDLNQIHLALLPLEPSLDLGRDLQASWPPDEPTFVVSHANDWTGYALTQQEYDTGGYEACLSFHGRDLADRLLETSEALSRD